MPPSLKIAAVVSPGTASFNFLYGVELALSNVNGGTVPHSDVLLPNTTLTVQVFNLAAANSTSGMVATARDVGASALLTAYGSAASIAMSQAATLVKLPVLSGGATSTALSSAVSHPFFARPVPADSKQSVALVDLCRRFAWSHVATVHDPTDTYSVGLEQGFWDNSGDAGIAVSRVEVV